MDSNSGGPHWEGMLRFVALLTLLSGVIACLFFGIQINQPDFVSVGSTAVRYGSHVDKGILLASAASLLTGLIWSLLLFKFATALELLHELRASLRPSLSTSEGAPNALAEPI